jgi:hypothetical protein
MTEASHDKDKNTGVIISSLSLLGLKNNPAWKQT